MLLLRLLSTKLFVFVDTEPYKYLQQAHKALLRSILIFQYLIYTKEVSIKQRYSQVAAEKFMPLTKAEIYKLKTL